eukprot:COSAG02_NODE_2678_length_8262_cov_5.072400_4_plen_289_part_00
MGAPDGGCAADADANAATTLLDADFAGFCPPQRWPPSRQAAAPTLAAPPPLRSQRFSFERAAAVAAAPPPPPRVPAGPPPPLPSEVYCTILSLCTPPDAARAAQTCRAWWAAFRSPGAWVQLDLTGDGPFGCGAEDGAHNAGAALAKFLAFMVAGGGVRLGCLETLAIEHSGCSEAQLCAEWVDGGSRPGAVAWEVVAPVVAAASPSLRSLTLRGPPPIPPTVEQIRPLVHTGVAHATLSHVLRPLLALPTPLTGLACPSRAQHGWRWTPGCRPALRRHSQRCRQCKH